MSVMMLLNETVRDEVHKVFDCECLFLTDLSCDRGAILDINENRRRLVPLFLFCIYLFCMLFTYQQGIVVICDLSDSLFLKFFLCVVFYFKVRSLHLASSNILSR